MSKKDILKTRYSKSMREGKESESVGKIRTKRERERWIGRGERETKTKKV